MLSRKLLVFCLVLLRFSGKAQEVIQHVNLQKAGKNVYRVQYAIKPADSLKVKAVTLKIFRRRQGKVEEVFNKEMDKSPVRWGHNYLYNWQADTTLVKAGDEVQARIVVAYTKTAKIITAANRPPKADAGEDMELQLPLRNYISLNGMRSYDEDGKIVRIRWRQVEGPVSLNFSAPEFYKTTVTGDVKEGRYVFEMTVTDSAGASASDRVNVIVKGAVAKVTPPPAVVNAPPVAKKDSLPKKASIARYEMPKLKGGPGNALVNLLLPGLGHYYVSGDHYGNNRKPQVLLISALYAGSIGGAIYYKLRSNNEYNKYIAQSQYREYQRDAAGNLIGVRGVSQAQATGYFEDAQTSHRNFLILTGVSAGILVSDLVFTLVKGMKNQKAWKREAGVSIKPFVTPGVEGMSVGMVLKWNK